MAKAKKEEVQETKTAKKKPAVKEVEQPDNVEVTEEPVEANEITTGTIKVGDLTISNEGGLLNTNLLMMKHHKQLNAKHHLGLRCGILSKSAPC